MREIKFRAWDKVRKEYLSGGRILLSIEPGNRPKHSYNFLDILTDPDKYRDRFIIEQYTGLKDKNGKEIYEGDIIIWGDKISREKGHAIYVSVEYKSGCFGINDGERFHEFYHYCAGKWDDELITDDMWGVLPLERYFRACFEVVGNIYENPELIGGWE